MSDFDIKDVQVDTFKIHKKGYGIGLDDYGIRLTYKPTGCVIESDGGVDIKILLEELKEKVRAKREQERSRVLMTTDCKNTGVYKMLSENKSKQ